MAGISREERLRRQALKDAESPVVPGSPMPNPPDGGWPTVADPVVPLTPNVVVPAAKSPEPPKFTIAERRLKHGDVAMMKGQADFELVGMPEPMSIYWGMTEDAHELITLKGWVPVEAKFLPMKPERMGLTTAPDGNVTRGKQGSEMLFMMPKKLRDEILHDQANRRQVMRLSRRTYMKQTAESAQAAAMDQSLSAAQRESAARAAASMESSQRAKWTVTEFTESHSRNSGVE